MYLVSEFIGNNNYCAYETFNLLWKTRSILYRKPVLTSCTAKEVDPICTLVALPKKSA